MGWAGMKNGALLQLAAESFNVLLTTDRNLAFQQNMATLRLSIIVLRAPSNDISVLRPLILKSDRYARVHTEKSLMI